MTAGMEIRGSPFAPRRSNLLTCEWFYHWSHPFGKLPWLKYRNSESESDSESNSELLEEEGVWNTCLKLKWNINHNDLIWSNKRINIFISLKLCKGKYNTGIFPATRISNLRARLGPWKFLLISIPDAVIGKRFLPNRPFQLFSMILKFSMGHLKKFQNSLEKKLKIDHLAKKKNLFPITASGMEISMGHFPPWGRRGFKSRIRPPYPQRVVKGD